MLNGLAARRRWRPIAGRRGRDEDGAVLVIFAVAAVGLMSFTAMAVDLGNISQTKSEAETAVQDAALSGVSDLANLYPGGPGIAMTQESQAVSDAESYLTKNFPSLAGDNFSTACAGIVWPSTSSMSMWVWPAANCFAFANPQNPGDNESNPTTMGVAVPTQHVAYTLGRAGGATTQAVTAVAYASLATTAGSDLLPFGYPNGGGTGGQCLKTGSGNGAASCTGFATGSGQFGVLNSPRYRIFPGSSTSASNNPAVATDVVLGIDHALQAVPAASPSSEVCDMTGSPPNCPAYNDTPTSYDTADYASPLTGQTLNLPGPALFTGGVVTPDGSCTLAPRLNHPNGFTASSSCSNDDPATAPLVPQTPWLSNNTFGSTYKLNGVQISYYLNATGVADTSACTADLPAGVNATKTPLDAVDSSGDDVWDLPPGKKSANDSYDQCLSSVITGLASNVDLSTTTPIFSASIEQSPRFAIVPIVGSSSGRDAEPITTFDGAYLDLAFGHNNTVDAIAAFVFPLSMISGAVSTGPSIIGYTGGPFVVNLCSPSAANC